MRDEMRDERLQPSTRLKCCCAFSSCRGGGGDLVVVVLSAPSANLSWCCPVLRRLVPCGLASLPTTVSTAMNSLDEGDVPSDHTSWEDEESGSEPEPLNIAELQPPAAEDAKGAPTAGQQSELPNTTGTSAEEFREDLASLGKQLRRLDGGALGSRRRRRMARTTAVAGAQAVQQQAQRMSAERTLRQRGGLSGHSVSSSASEQCHDDSLWIVCGPLRRDRIQSQWHKISRFLLRFAFKRRVFAQLGQLCQAIKARGRDETHHLLR